MANALGLFTTPFLDFEAAVDSVDALWAGQTPLDTPAMFPTRVEPAPHSMPLPSADAPYTPGGYFPASVSCGMHRGNIQSRELSSATGIVSAPFLVSEASVDVADANSAYQTPLDAGTHVVQEMDSRSISPPPSAHASYAPDGPVSDSYEMTWNWNSFRRPTERSSARPRNVMYRPYTPSIASSRASTPASPSPYFSLPYGSAFTTPATTPEPVDGPSRVPSSGPVRSSRQRRPHIDSQSNWLGTSGLRIKMETFGSVEAADPCPSVGTANVEQLLQQARDTQVQKFATVRCSWNGCTETIILADLKNHLLDDHHLRDAKEKVQCLWGSGFGCASEPMQAGSLAKHVLSQKHLDVHVRCPTCGQGYQRREGLRKHLLGGAKK
ncbi:hypothetical protein MVEN_02244900 [Mycena venus]|uniref:C2H2-type domain-containing protein n=1 Tax=Mycena venus TaxID=2733690 RepID=A0A8H6X5M8_9AGAR|nr:hypothetical protein MVEN_02244900 [Mycena venus]